MEPTILIADSEPREELSRLYLSVQNQSVARRLWERTLSHEQRESLGGDFKNAYLDGGTIGMWTRARGGSPSRALMEVAYRMSLTDSMTANWLLRGLGEPQLDISGTGGLSLPSWDSGAVRSPTVASSFVALPIAKRQKISWRCSKHLNSKVGLRELTTHCLEARILCACTGRSK